ncbi:MAG TPA: hypothetical protein VGE52_05155, partial [Pirellulales bacterium]
TNDDRVHKRLHDLILYTRHAELYYGYAAGVESLEAVARHDYRMRTTMMVHTYGLWSRMLSQQAALDPNHPWKDERPFTSDELNKIVVDGIVKNIPAEPGFVGVEFSNKLAPATPLKLPSVPEGRFPDAPQDHQRYYVWLPDTKESLDLRIAVKKRWLNRLPKATLYSPQEVSLNAVAVDESYPVDDQFHDVKLKTPYSGLHRLETIDGGDYTRIEWPAGLPVTLESGIDTPGVTSHFRGSWTLYFYVPKGTKVVGGWASRIANWAPRISGKLVDPDGKTALDFEQIEEGWFKVPVAEGQDAKLWKFENSQGQRLLMTVPPYMARRAEELLLPAEVISADAQP